MEFDAKKAIEETVGAILQEVKNYEPGISSGEKSLPKEYVPTGAIQETEVDRALRKGKEAADEVGGKVAKGAKTIIDKIKDNPGVVAGGTAAAIAAGLGALALAKKMRKGKKAPAKSKA